MSTPMLPIKSTPEAETKKKADAAAARTRKAHKFLAKLHLCGTLTLRTIASGFIIAVLLWLVARNPDPQVHVTKFDIQALHANPPTPLPTIINYNFALHNPGLYKSIYYDVLVLSITYSNEDGTHGAMVNFNPDGKSIKQRPGKTINLSNRTLDYSNSGLLASNKDLEKLKTEDVSIYLMFVMEVRYKVFNSVISTRQFMRTASLYFDKDGQLIVNNSGGLALR